MLVDQLAPAVQPVLADGGNDDLVDEAVAANVRYTVDTLSNSSAVIRDLIAEGKLTIVGATYSLETGEVEFLG